MPRDFREFLMMLRHREGRESPKRMLMMLEELGAALRHGEFVFRDPMEMEEFAHWIERYIERGEIPPDYFDRLMHELLMSIDMSPMPPSFKQDLRHLLMRQIERLHDFPMRDEEKKKKDKKEKEHEESIQKSIESIKSIRLSENDKVLFFIGAGASKPSPSNIPTVNELLPELWKKSSRLETKPLEKLQTWCRENSIENIEEMLTAVTISNFIIKSPKVHGLLNSVLYPEWKSIKEISIRDIDAVLLLDNMLNTFFSLLVGTMLQAKPNAIHQAIAGYAKKNNNVDILTTNYDSCLDQSLDESSIKYNYVFNTADRTDTLSLVKMHGSINWFYCDTCQSVYLPSIASVAEAIKKDIPYAVTGMCRQCNAPVEQFIIPPVAHKYLTHPPIVQVWDRGRKTLEEAKLFVIIGYSFADADDYIAKMLVKSVGQSPDKNIVVIDIDEKAINRCRTFIKLHVDAFDDKKKFFPICGDALHLVPRVLDALSDGKKTEKSKK